MLETKATDEINQNTDVETNVPVSIPKAKSPERLILFDIFKDREVTGGGAQVMYYPPKYEGGPGVRLYQNSVNDFASVETDPQLRLLDNLTHHNEVNSFTRELLPQLFLQEDLKVGVPQMYGIGVYDPRKAETYYYELSSETTLEQKYELVNKLWNEWSNRTSQKQFFTLVEHISHAHETDDLKLDTYCYPQQLAESSPKAYVKGFRAGLMFYLKCLQAGIWNFDLRDKEPFICKGDEVKVLDTGGFAVIRGTEAEADISHLYHQLTDKMEEPLNNRLSSLDDDPFNTERQELRRKIFRIDFLKHGIREALDNVTRDVTYANIAQLLERSYFSKYVATQKETDALKELKSCYESLNRGESYWDASSPEELLEMFIIMLRRHSSQLLNLQ